MRSFNVEFSIIFILSSVSLVSSENFANKLNITSCDKSSEKFLVVKTVDKKIERIDLEENESLLYNFIVEDLICEGNVDTRKLKPNVYNDDDWEFAVRIFKAVLSFLCYFICFRTDQYTLQQENC